MADIRLKKISVDSSPLIIQNGTISITNTTVSDTILTGAMVSNGGIAISCTTNSISSSNGGALTVGGGIASMKDIYIGKSLILDSLESTIVVNGISENRLFLDNITNKNFHISLDGVYKTFEINEEGVYINNNTPSENFTTGALRILGGLTINSTEQSTSTSSGSGITVFGGAGIVKKLYVGGGIQTIESSNTIGNLITTTNGNIGIGISSPLSNLSVTTNTLGSKITLWDANNELKHFGFGITDNQLNYDVSNVNDDHVFYSNSKNGSGTEIFRIKGIGKVEVTGDLSATGYITPSNGTGNAGIIFTNENDINDNAWIKYYETDTNNYNLEIGTSNDIEDNIVLLASGNVGIDTTSPMYTLDVNGTISGTTFTGGNAQFSETVSAGTIRTTTIHATTYTGGNIQISGSISSSNMYTTNIITNTLQPGSSTTEQNKIIINGEESIDRYIKFNTDDGNAGIIFSELDNYSFYQCMSNGILSISGTEGNPSIVGEKGSSFFIINTSGNVGINTTDATHKLTVNGDTIISGNSTFGSFFIVSDKIGINNTSPTQNFDINTDTRITNILTIENNVQSENSTTGTLILKNGGIGIDCTEEATSYTCGGAMTIAGGVSINKNMYVNENAYINGVVTIQNMTESTDTSSGALRISGGLSIIKNVNIGGKTTTEKLVVTSVQSSINSTSGSIISNGGVTILSTQNATSSTIGGALTITGGVGIGKDIYINGNGFNRGVTNYYSEANNFIQIYNGSDEKIYSLDRNYFNNEFSLSRYNAGSLIEKTFDLSHTTGIFKFNNTTNSSSKTNASVIITGGMSINSTENSQNTTVGGALSIYGGQSIVKDLHVGGNVYINGTEQSINVSTGSLIIKGGVSVFKDVNIEGNTSINGDLYVRGTTTSIETSNTVLKDNILVLNSAPSGMKDSGIIISRFQEDNDTGFGDVVNENVYIDLQIPTQVGMTDTEIKFPITASAINDYYKDWWIKITSGFSNSQVRKIIAYDGNTKIATVSSSWTLQNPAENDVVFLYNRVYVGLIYNETDDVFVFGSTLEDPGNSIVSLTDNIKVKTGEMIISSTKDSTNSSSGAIVVNGGLSIQSTQNATSNTVGGALSINGGASIRKTLYVGEELYINNANLTPNPGDKWKSTIFLANNNQLVAENITDLDMDTNAWGFDIFLTARLEADLDLYANYHLRGVNKVDSWEIVKTYVGDDMGLEFYITNDGEVQYTSQDYAGFISLQFKWRVFAN